MPFPVTWRGKFTVPTPTAASVTADEVLGGMARALETARASDLTISAGRITYHVPVVSGRTGLNIIKPFDGGTVAVRSVRAGLQVDFDVSFRGVLWIAVGSLAFIPLRWLADSRRPPFLDMFPDIGVIWLLMFGPFMVVAFARYAALLRRVVRSEVEAAAADRARLAKAQSA